MSLDLLKRHSIYLYEYWNIRESLIDVGKVNDVFLSFDLSTFSICIGNRKHTYAKCVSNGNVATIRKTTNDAQIQITKHNITKFPLSPMKIDVIRYIDGKIVKRRRLYRSHTKDKRYIFTVIYFFIKINNLVEIDIVLFIKKDRYTKKRWFFALPVYMNIV